MNTCVMNRIMKNKDLEYRGTVNKDIENDGTNVK